MQASLCHRLAVTVLAAGLLPVTAHGQSHTPAQAVKVFILAGQSNMEGKVQNPLLEHQAKDDKTAALFAHLRKAGKWVVRDDVFIKFLKRKGGLTMGYGSPGRTGVELEFGHVLGEKFDQPVLLIKAAWGGHSLFKLFRSPSAGMPAASALQLELKQARQRTKNQNANKMLKRARSALAAGKFEQARADASYALRVNPKNKLAKDVVARATELLGGKPGMQQAGNKQPKGIAQLPAMEQITEPYGRSYRNMMQEVKDVFTNYETMFPSLKGKKLQLAGFLWFQGWNDQYGAQDDYHANMKHFINDVRKDLQAPKLPFVIGLMGQNGSDQPKGAMLTIQQAQAAMAELPEFRGNVKAVRTDVLVDKAAEQLYPTWKKNLEQWKLTGSDHKYHYLGSAIWHLRMGRAFGDAMLEMLEKH